MVSGLFSSSYRITYSIHQLHYYVSQQCRDPITGNQWPKGCEKQVLANCHVDDDRDGDDEEDGEDEC